jgi:hypothetical protein
VTMEKWKVVEGFEAYEVSDLGRVRRCIAGKRTKIGRLLIPVPDKDGYLTVGLHKLKRNFKKIHRLVAQAFIPNPLGLPEVNHLGRKTDNRMHKLEWRSNLGHKLDQVRRNQHGEGVSFSKQHRKYRVKVRDKFIGTFSTKQAALAARQAAVEALPEVL